MNESGCDHLWTRYWDHKRAKWENGRLVNCPQYEHCCHCNATRGAHPEVAAYWAQRSAFVAAYYALRSAPP